MHKKQAAEKRSIDRPVKRFMDHANSLTIFSKGCRKKFFYESHTHVPSAPQTSLS